MKTYVRRSWIFGSFTFNLKTNKMTAVEWLVEQLKINNYISDNAHWLIDDAKEMEKGQIIDAFEEGYYDEKTSEQYYNEQFNK